MPADYVGVEVARSEPYRRRLEKTLRAWGRLQRQYLRETGDLPYWYNERSNVGLLAAAGWRAGGISLE